MARQGAGEWRSSYRRAPSHLDAGAEARDRGGEPGFELTPTEVARKYAISSGGCFMRGDSKSWEARSVSSPDRRRVLRGSSWAALRRSHRTAANPCVGDGSCVPGDHHRQVLDGLIEIALSRSGILVRVDAEVDGRGLAPRSRCPGQLMIALSPSGRVYLACGVTDMRKGSVGLAMLLVQQSLSEDPFDGSLYAFRGRRSGLIKLIWQRRDRPVHADEAARARPIPLAICQHDRPDRIITSGNSWQRCLMDASGAPQRCAGDLNWQGRKLR